jgi:hypothetical protein
LRWLSTSGVIYRRLRVRHGMTCVARISKHCKGPSTKRALGNPGSTGRRSRASIEGESTGARPYYIAVGQIRLGNARPLLRLAVILTLVALAAQIVCLTPTVATPARSGRTSCGGLNLPYQTTIGLSLDGNVRRPSSIEGLAAIVRKSSLRAKAWVIWDERARPWIATTRNFDPVLVRFYHLSLPSGRGEVNAFTPLSSRALRLPTGYALLACDSAQASR